MISREGILKIDNTLHKEIIQKKKENKLKNYINYILFFIGILSCFNVFFFYALPFVFSLSAFIIHKDELNKSILAIMIIGVMFSLNFQTAIKLFLAIILMTVLNRNSIIKSNDTSYSILCATMTLFSGIIINFLFKNPPIYNVYLLVECLSMVILFFIYNTSYNLVLNYDLKKELSAFEAVSLCIVCCIIILGLSDIFIFDISLSMILLITFLLLSLTYFPLSLSLCFSLIGSILLTLKGGYSTDIILILTSSTLFGSLTNKISKKLSICLFFFCCITLSVYINKSIIFTVPILDTLIGCLVFSIVSFFADDKINTFLNARQKDFHGNIFNSAIKKTIKEEIENKKNMIKEISYNISLNEENKNDNKAKDICKILTADICTSCENFAKCWNEKGEETFVNFSQVILDTYNGKISSKDDLPKTFINNCKYNFFIYKSASYLCDNLKIEKDYKNKLFKFKELMNLEFKGINKTLDNIYLNIKKGLSYFSKDEENIREGLFNLGIIVKENVVLEDFRGKIKIYIKTAKRLDNEEYRMTVPLLLGEILQKNIMYDYSSYNEENLNAFEYTFIEKKPFSLSVGMKRGKRNDKDECGDNFSNTVLPTNNHLIALADGMGTGSQASMQSERVLNLLEEMLGCETEEIDSVNTINTILSLEEKEIFTTLDIVLFNLYNAKAEFIKAGALESYIKRNDEVITISSQALPIGIIDNINVKKETFQLQNNDYVYIISDGFLEAFTNDRELIKEKILNTQFRNPQKIADELFNEAYARSLGKLKDDVSIIVFKVREEI